MEEWGEKMAKFLELVSKELNHFGVIAGLFRQIGGHSSRFVLFFSFWRLFTIEMIKSVKVFPFSFWKIIMVLNTYLIHIFWEGHTILQNLHLTFDWHYIGQK